MSTNSGLAVLVPVYNNQSGLTRTLKNLDALPEIFDVVVVDDGSAPPITIPAGLSPAHPVRLNRLMSNFGIARALNEGLALLEAAQYRYVARLDAGDEAVNGRFSKQILFLDANPRCAAVSSFIDFFEPAGETAFIFEAPTAHRDILREMHRRNCLIHSGTTMRLDVVQASGGYSERYPVAEDYELFLRLSRKSELAVIPEVLTRCEHNPAGLSLARSRRQQLSRLKLQCEYFDPTQASSYAGVIRTIVALGTPQPLVAAWKRRTRRG